MNRKMIKALKNKYIYVDIDGTIAEYRFNNHVNAKDGTTNGQTMKEIENHIFLYSRPLKTVIQTLKRAKKEGIWICGAIISPVELLDKIVWLEENCIVQTVRLGMQTCTKRGCVSIMMPSWISITGQ